MRRALFQTALALIGVAAFLALLLWLNPVLRDRLRGQDRYRFRLADVACSTPPGLDRAAFLEEVQYYAELPAHLDLLRDDLEDHLKQAFARHPWVKRVEGVRVRPEGGIEASLLFRTPVLAVRSGSELRAVDEEGVLLPKSAPMGRLSLLEEDVDPPQGPEGSPWGDPRVEDAARKAGNE